eukprot:CAMPEP_0115103420 /NCGR_PEP_ID=MMETSP0227-20121206/34593_1 /TAXON_ID=89957 /ORGANISM="Polarella glacialis, Strain CCMP 1383" /LENGTH=98 /DNA_ID=CAMNT_0002499911 /DNA_START=106 /DNA_END=399 /DNA_ORIENTATION=-
MLAHQPGVDTSSDSASDTELSTRKSAGSAPRKVRSPARARLEVDEAPNPTKLGPQKRTATAIRAIGRITRRPAMAARRSSEGGGGGSDVVAVVDVDVV